MIEEKMPLHEGWKAVQFAQCGVRDSVTEDGVETSGGNFPERSRRFGYAEMLRDVFVAAIDQGQLLLAVIGLVSTIVVLKFSAQELIALVVKVLDSLERACVLGYVVAAVLVVLCFLRSRARRPSKTD
jgi:hypothetical protein